MLYVIQNGSLLRIDENFESFDIFEHYCLDMDEDEQILTAIVCEFDEAIFRVNRAQALIFATCMIISVPVNYFLWLLSLVFFFLISLIISFLTRLDLYKSECFTKKKQQTHTVSKREKKIHCFWHKNSISSSKKARKKLRHFMKFDFIKQVWGIVWKSNFFKW